MIVSASRIHSHLISALSFILCVANFVSAQTEDRVLARVNGRAITQKEVDKTVVAQTLPLEEKLYAIRKAALENLIISRLLEDEAKKRGISIASLRRELSAGPVAVSDSQVEEAYAENSSFFASMSPDEAKERLRLDLESQQRMKNYRTAIAKLRAAAKIDIVLDEPRLPPLAGDATAHSLGSENAPVTIIEYSDFECGYCRAVQPAIKQVLQSYQRDVRLVFKHLPLQIHENALPAAQAAVCAGEQNVFWPFHDAVFALEALDRKSLETVATRVGVNLSDFKSCSSSERAAARVQMDMREANQLGISSTPTFIINGRIARGALTFDQFKTIIEEELKSAGISSKPQPQPARKGLDR
jgi:protein-disulfide isomerase